MYPFIEAEKQGSGNVKRACELLKVSRAAYYAARGDVPSERDRQDVELTPRIKDARLLCGAAAPPDRSQR